MRGARLERSLDRDPSCPGEKGLTTELGSPGMSLAGETLNLPQPLAGNLWLDSSMSAEPEPKSLWFPGSQPLCTRRQLSELC